MTDDKDRRKTVKLSPDVGELFEEEKPPDMTQSEFVKALLEGAEIKEGVTAGEVRRIVREELERIDK